MPLIRSLRTMGNDFKEAEEDMVVKDVVDEVVEEVVAVEEEVEVGEEDTTQEVEDKELLRYCSY